jgi:hypothetical protein
VLVSPTSTGAHPASFRPTITIDGTDTRVLVEQTTVVDPQRLDARQAASIRARCWLSTRRSHWSWACRSAPSKLSRMLREQVSDGYVTPTVTHPPTTTTALQVLRRAPTRSFAKAALGPTGRDFDCLSGKQELTPALVRAQHR